MYGKSKAKYLESQNESIREENRSLRAENKVLQDKIDSYEEMLEASNAAIERLKQRLSEAEASYAEEIEKAHEARLAFYEARDEVREMKKLYKAELQNVLKRARKAFR